MKVKFLFIVSQNKSRAQNLCSGFSPCLVLRGTLERPSLSACVGHTRRFRVSSCHRSSAFGSSPLWALEISHAGCWPTFRASAGEKGKQEVVKKNRSLRDEGSGEVLERKTKPLAFDFCVSLLCPGSHPSRTWINIRSPTPEQGQAACIYLAL